MERNIVPAVQAKPNILASALVIIVMGLTASHVSAEVIRTDLTVQSAPEIDLFIREVRNKDAPSWSRPVLLLHGARVGGLASFDVDVGDVSLAEDLAEAGYTVYVADLRGYGRSSFPAAMDDDRFSSPPAVPTAEAIEDVKAVIEEIARRHEVSEISAFGWATGAHWLASTEAAYPGSIDRLVFFNSVYGGEGDWKLTENFAVPGFPAIFNYGKFGSYRLSDAESLVGRWTEVEGISDAFIARYVELAMEGDPTARSRDPASFRHPSGPIADTIRVVNDGPLYDASNIRSDVLILRSGNDFWSRPVDVTTLAEDLTAAGDVTVIELSGASHYVHLEPGEKRDVFFRTVTDYLADGALDSAGATAPSKGLSVIEKKNGMP